MLRNDALSCTDTSSLVLGDVAFNSLSTLHKIAGVGKCKFLQLI